jgi:hypothetical protein
MPMLHPSGGLGYHLRAWRHRRLWAPFHAVVAQWLAGWQPAARRLVLVGPSAGYALPRAFLAGFTHIHVLEPDPVARWLLTRRFAGMPLTFDAGRWFARPHGGAELAARHADAAFLFCNLLGQELVGQPRGHDRARWLTALAQALQGRPWASWHELVSTGTCPGVTSAVGWYGPACLEDVLALFWPQGGELALIDHATFGMMPAWPRQYALWRLSPARWHVIEWLPAPHG